MLNKRERKGTSDLIVGIKTSFWLIDMAIINKGDRTDKIEHEKVALLTVLTFTHKVAKLSMKISNCFLL